jgi:O-antigen/teichoic acid export membrane protein
VKDILGIGLNFFIIQIAAIILFSTDNIIITQLFGPKEVTPYNIAFKYFSIVTMGFSIIVIPYWSAITEAYTKKDFLWIKKSMNTLLKLSIIFSLGAIVLIIFSNEFYFFWVGDLIQVPFTLSLFMGIYVIIGAFGRPFNHFVNGTGKIKIQLCFAVFGAVMNIPLSIYFAKYLDFGSSGVILATIVCEFIGLVILPVQYNKIINNKAHGIWNK